MGVFENCSVLLDLKDLTFKDKKKLKATVTETGGSISFVVNKQCSLVVTSSAANLSSNRLRSIRKYRTPVVGPDYVLSCVDRGVLLPLDEYRLDVSSSSPSSPVHRRQLPSPAYPRDSPVPEDKNHDEECRVYSELDSDIPEFPDDFQVAKYAIFEKRNSSSWCVVELQSARTKLGRTYRVVRYWKDDLAAKKVAVKDRMFFLPTSEKALEVYESLTQLDSSSLQRRSSVPLEAQHLGSAPLQQLLLEEKLNTGSVSQEVAMFVEMLWTEALGRIDTVLNVPISDLSLNDVSRAEGLLLQAQKKLKEGAFLQASSLLHEVQNLLPHRNPRPPRPTTWVLSQKLDLCQLIRDVLNVSEMTLRSAESSCVGKYRALRCSMETLPPDGSVFRNIAGLLRDSPVKIHQIVSVSRGAELQSFKAELGNIKPLLHSSSPSNFVGILSRGLLLPRVGVEHHGIERTDVGYLGSGIYFSDSVRTSLKYSKPSETDGSRLLLLCDVALGRCKDVLKRDPTLSQAPEGHHSVHGVRRAQNPESDFEDDEFVVYSPDQVKIKFVVQFSVEGDQLRDFHPEDHAAVSGHLDLDQELVSVDVDMENIKNPLEDVTAGLLDSSGQQLPLQAVHVKCKLVDLLSQVIIFQKYTNLSSVAIEAKYVFPLGDSAAVCGFEAFINGKHVVGQVKEKEAARREYRQAIEKGHGAYLMDQDAPDIFTISVGNLPPGATVLIKVTFVSELVVRDGSVLFSLPGSVAPWQESAALKQTTQVSVQKVCVTDEAANRDFTLDVSVEMPNKISELRCSTHQVKMKRTDCKAVVSVLPGQVMGPDGFQLSVGLSEVHLPRMWVEKHPDKDSQACMLVFYPDFELDSGSEADEVVLVLDTSESMRGEWLGLAQRIALQVLKKLQNSTRINVVLFGTDHTEAFLKAQPLSEVRQAAESFIERCSPAGGGTELWRPLRALGLLPPSRGIRNLLLLSDGHIQNPALTLQLLRDDAPHSRLFTCGLSRTANRHMLRALAEAGGGAYEFFDTKTKHSWAEKVMRQVKRMSSPGCSSVSVKWQQFNPTAPPPVQAPKQLHALFSDYHTLVYGLVPHCTQATLLGNLRGQELKSVVSTTELQKTRGTFLHKLTARALIRDYEDGSLGTTEAGHEEKKAELKSFIIELSKEFSVLSQFTSFVAIEEREQQGEDGVTDIPKLIAEEDVDFLSYISWTSPEETQTPTIEEDRSGILCLLDTSSQYMDVSLECAEFSPLSSPSRNLDSLFAAPEVQISSTQFTETISGPTALGMFASPYKPAAPEVQTSSTRFTETLSGPTALGMFASPYKLAARVAEAGFSFGFAAPQKSTFGSAAWSSDSALEECRPAPRGPEAGFSFYHSAPGGSVFGSAAEFSESDQALHITHTARRHQQQQQQQLRSSHRDSGSGSGSTMTDVMPAHLRRQNRLRRSSYACLISAPPPPPAPQSIPTPPPPPQEDLSKSDGFMVDMWHSVAHSMDEQEEDLCDEDMESDLLRAASPVFQTQKMVYKRSGVRFSDVPSAETSRPKTTETSRDPDPEELKHKWTKIFQLQHSDGYWELTTHLGQFIRLNVDVFVNVFLKNKGICSLGTKAHADILRMVATLLVLQLMRVEKLEEGKLLRNLFHMDESSELRSQHWDRVKKAVDWVRWADRQYPCICSRLELGLSWESCTRQLLGFDGLPSFSSLIGLDLLIH